jgi:YHS domain-containing protein
MKALFTTLALALFAAASLNAAEPVNEKCPVCGKSARLIFRTNYKGQHILFASADCKDKFEKTPDKFKVEPKK